MKKSRLLFLFLYSQLSVAAPAEQLKKNYDNAEEAIAALSQKITPGVYSGHTSGEKTCQMRVEYFSTTNGTFASFLIESSSTENSQQPVVVTITDHKNLVFPTSEMISGQQLIFADSIEKFIFGILSAGNTEKYLSLEVGPTEISVLARQGYILDPETPRILCLDMRK